LHRFALGWLLVAAVAALAACSGGDSDGGGEGDGEFSITIDNQTVVEGDPVASLAVTLTGGADAGEYEAATPVGGCSYGLTGVDGFGLQHSVDEPEGFTSHQLIVPSTAKAADGSSTFRTTVTIGPLREGNNYDINTLPDAEQQLGSGTVTVDDRGETATITIQATTAEGVGIDATVECLEVLRVQ